MNKPNHSVAKVFRFEDSDSGRYWLVKVVGTPETPEWVFSDVVPILYPDVDRDEYSNYLAQIPPVWKSQKQIVTSEGEQMVSTLYESGLNYLIARSESPLMIYFQQWIARDIIPAIRSNNNYLIVNQSLTFNSNTKEKLETIRLGMDLLYELGGVDEYMRLVLREKVRGILLEDGGSIEKEFIPTGEVHNGNHTFKTLEQFHVIANGSGNGDHFRKDG